MSWYLTKIGHQHSTALIIWDKSWRCGCLVTWFCYLLIAKPGKKTAAPLWLDPYQVRYNLIWGCINDFSKHLIKLKILFKIAEIFSYLSVLADLTAGAISYLILLDVISYLTTLPNRTGSVAGWYWSLISSGVVKPSYLSSTILLIISNWLSPIC